MTQMGIVLVVLGFVMVWHGMGEAWAVRQGSVESGEDEE